MTDLRRPRNSRRRVLRQPSDSVVRPVASMGRIQVAACSLSLLAAGVLLTHGFIGLVPGRPVFVVLGALLAASAVAGLALDHVSVQSIAVRPDHMVVDELNRCRRGSHSLTLVSIDCGPEVGARIVRRMRCEDRAWRRKHRLHLMLIETNREEAEGFLLRITDLVADEQVRLATFPDDAVTIDSLYDRLRPPKPKQMESANWVDLTNVSDVAELVETAQPLELVKPMASAGMIDLVSSTNRDVAVGEG